MIQLTSGAELRFLPVRKLLSVVLVVAPGLDIAAGMDMCVEELCLVETVKDVEKYAEVDDPVGMVKDVEADLVGMVKDVEANGHVGMVKDVEAYLVGRVRVTDDYSFAVLVVLAAGMDIAKTTVSLLSEACSKWLVPH